MAGGLLGCADGKQVEFCLCLVGSGMATLWHRLWWAAVRRHFGGQRYGDILVGSGMATFWWAAVWRHFGGQRYGDILVGSGMATFWYRLEGCTISMHCNVGFL